VLFCFWGCLALDVGLGGLIVTAMFTVSVVSVLAAVVRVVL
jgi:hypothetical protein